MKKTRKARRIFTVPSSQKLKLEKDSMTDETPLYILIVGMIAGMILALTLRWIF